MGAAHVTQGIPNHEPAAESVNLLVVPLAISCVCFTLTNDEPRCKTSELWQEIHNVDNSGIRHIQSSNTH